MSNNDTWQVDVGGEVYETDLPGLFEWVGEGSLKPSDKVRKGNLRWVNAGLVPSLKPAFDAINSGEPVPVLERELHEDIKANDAETSILENPESEVHDSKFPHENVISSTPNTDNTLCAVHNDVPSAYICRTCANAFCKTCPTSYGGNVKICPFCGAMCEDIKQTETAKTQANLDSFKLEGFGFSDLISAFAVPFNFGSSFIIASIIVIILTLGNQAMGVGGLIFGAASIACGVMLNAILFGTFATTLENNAQGRLKADFMPSFTDFSLWDNIIHPFFLSIAVYISAFGPFIIATIIGVFLVFSSINAERTKIVEQVQNIPGTTEIGYARAGEQSLRVSEITRKAKEAAAENIQLQTEIAESGGTAPPPTVAPTPDFQALLREQQAAMEVQMKQQQEALTQNFFARFLRLAAPLVVIMIITFIFGLLYVPAVAAVAGYSRSIFTTLNPSVVFDTIKRLGGDYVRLVVMTILLLIISMVIHGVIAMIFSPLSFRNGVNIPAAVVSSVVSLFFIIVFGALIGFALLKNSNKLRLYRA